MTVLAYEVYYKGSINFSGLLCLVERNHKLIYIFPNTTNMKAESIIYLAHFPPEFV